MENPRTKLVCTIGPASVERVRELVDAGMSVARINFSHGTPEEHRAAVHAVRAAAHHARRSVAVMVDLPGPKIRLGDVPDGLLELEAGQLFRLRPIDRERPGAPQPSGDTQPSEPTEPSGPTEPTAATEPAAATADGATDPNGEHAAIEPEADGQPTEPSGETEPAAPAAEGEPSALTMPSELTAPSAATEPSAAATPAAATDPAHEATADRATLASELEVGDRVLLADGAAELRVTEIAADGAVLTEVVRGGTIRSRSGVNIPTERLVGPALTAFDEEAIPRAIELRVDMIAQSFVRSADDVAALRARLPVESPLVVAKIETRAAVDAFDAIAQASDGVMVARGDLGVDLAYEEVPLVQKDLLRRARAAGRFSIVATQMLESMTTAARPTRAEASDVANAVLDGTDAVMLSAETAIGRYPVEAARAMIGICAMTERHARPTSAEGGFSLPHDGPSAIVHGACALAAEYDPVSAVWCFTRSGRTAELLAHTRPRVPVLAFTVSAVVARRLAARWGVVPLVIPAGRTGEPLIDRMEAAARARQAVAGAATVLLLTTSSQPGGVNRLELHRVE